MEESGKGTKVAEKIETTKNLKKFDTKRIIPKNQKEQKRTESTTKTEEGKNPTNQREQKQPKEQKKTMISKKNK